MSEALCYLSAVELLEAYGAKRLSPVEVTKAVLARIDDLNPVLNAFNLVDDTGALEAAEASERRWHAGAPEGLLDGIPATIKDLVLVKDWPTLKGSLTVDPAGPWTEDGPATARLKEHNAILLGKTTTPEFGWKGVTDSALTGITRNAWDPQKTPGGSSGGAAAALAGGMGALGIGTDGGGSIRIPCGFSGLFGIKANFGRVPQWPASTMGTLSHLGPMARTVADGALMLQVLAQPDSRDWMSLPASERDWSQTGDTDLKGLKIAFSPTLGYVDVDAEVADAVAKAVTHFSDCGATVEEADPGFQDPTDIFRILWWVGAAKGLGGLSAEDKAKMDPALAQIVEEGAAFSAMEYMQAVDARLALGELMRAFHRDYDLLVTPTLAVLPFTAGELVPAHRPQRFQWLDWTPFSYPFNLTQQPAATVNCGFSETGLPIGLHIVADNFREDLVLRAAAAFEATQPPIAWPTAEKIIAGGSGI